MHDQGMIALKNALSSSTIIYRNCLPSAPAIRGHASVTDLKSDIQRSKNFVRYYSYHVEGLDILGWPSGEIGLDAFSKLEVVTLGKEGHSSIGRFLENALTRRCTKTIAFS